MAKYIEVIQGPHKGLRCFVRKENFPSDHYLTFDNLELKKTDCVEIAYEKYWTPEKNRGCRKEW